MPSFKDIAAKRISDIEKPKNPPVGFYVFKIDAVPQVREMTTANGSFESLDFQCSAVQALDGVDQMEVQTFGIQNVRSRYSFMFNKDDATRFERSEWELRQFLTLIGVPEEASLGEGVGSSAGRTFIGQLGLREDKKKPGDYYPEITNVAAVS